VCEYCGCQEVTAIGELTREHDLVVALIAGVRAAYADRDTVAGTTRMAAVARQITAILAPHTQVEELGLFPALADEFEDHVTALQAEHRRVDAVLAEAATTVPVDPTWPRRLIDALEVLREHILKEQDGVFPAALTTLRTADWEAIDAVRARVGTLLPAAGG
jgi:hemerythrin-like domain-containing protein